MEPQQLQAFDNSKNACSWLVAKMQPTWHI